MSREGPYTLTVEQQHCGGCRYHGIHEPVPGHSQPAHRCWHAAVTTAVAVVDLAGYAAGNHGRFIGSTDSTPGWCPCNGKIEKDG